tara:strand:- start:93 stop:713 length:621 start_codon:yes stop_codon:yes gene_type:complete
MKTLQQHKQDFIKRAREFDTGKTDEDFHSYLRQHNLEHHLSETQIRDRNRENNSLNGLGLVAGIAIPLTFGAIFGIGKMMKEINSVGAMGGVFRETVIPESNLEGAIEQIRGGVEIPPAYDDSALSGTNTRPMPRADTHIGEDTFHRLQTNIMGNIYKRAGENTLQGLQTDVMGNMKKRLLNTKIMEQRLATNIARGMEIPPNYEI